MNWTAEQHKAWFELVEWSEKVSREGAKKLLEHAGMHQETLRSSQVFNVQDDVAQAIRRGAIRILNQLNGGGDTGDF